MKIISFANHKGGVGKTTTTLNVGAGLALMGHRVLLIDLDPQMNLSQGLGVQKSDKSVYEVLSGKCRLSPVEIDENLFLLPSSFQLKDLESEFINRIGGQVRLKKVLSDLKGFDFVLIDCPPSLGLLTINALTCSDDLVIPMTPEYYSIKGIVSLFDVLDEVRDTLNPNLSLSGIVVTLFNKQKIVHRDIVSTIEESFGDIVFKTRIRNSVSIEEAPHWGKDVLKYAPDSIGANDYRALSKEFSERYSM